MKENPHGRAGKRQYRIACESQYSIRNRTQSVIIEASTTNEQTPYHFPTTPAPLPPNHPHELKLLSRSMEAGILGFWNRNSAQGIRTFANYWNPESKFH